MSDETTTSEHEEIQALYSEYYEGELQEADRKRVAAHLADCSDCKAEYDEMVEALEVMSGLGKVTAPPDFDERVEATIERRSAGRFFGGRRMSDKLPLTILGLIAVGIGLALYLWLRSSETGSLERRPEPEEPAEIEPEVREVLPQP